MKLKRAIVYGGTGTGSTQKDFSYTGVSPLKSLIRRTGMYCQIFEAKETETALAWGINLIDRDGYPRGKVWIKTLKN